MGPQQPRGHPTPPLDPPPLGFKDQPVPQLKTLKRGPDLNPHSFLHWTQDQELEDPRIASKKNPKWRRQRY